MVSGREAPPLGEADGADPEPEIEAEGVADPDGLAPSQLLKGQVRFDWGAAA